MTDIIQTVELCNRTAGVNSSTFIREYLGESQGFSHTENVAFNTEAGSELAQRRSHPPSKPIFQQLENGERNLENYAIYHWLSGMGVLIHKF